MFCTFYDQVPVIGVWSEWSFGLFDRNIHGHQERAIPMPITVDVLFLTNVGIGLDRPARSASFIHIESANVDFIDLIDDAPHILATFLDDVCDASLPFL